MAPAAETGGLVPLGSTGLLGAPVDQLSGRAADRGRGIVDSQLVSTDAGDGPRLGGTVPIGEATALDLDRVRPVRFVYGVGADGCDRPLHRGLVLSRRRVQAAVGRIFG